MKDITPLISLKDVSKFYNANTTMAIGLHKVNVTFYQGEFVAVTGASGSGKSTLLNVLSGIDGYEEGEMFLRGNSTSHFDEKDRAEYRKNDVAFIFQDYFLIDSYTVFQNIELALFATITDKNERKKRVFELIEKVGLKGFDKHRAAKLSGGQKQRVAIARALAKNSNILFADEPTGNLDSKTSKDILELLHSLSKEKLVIVVTHSFDEIAPYATRKIRMSDGEIVEDIVLKKDVEIECDSSISCEFDFKKQFRGIASVAKYNLKGTPKRTIFTFGGLMLLSLALILVIVFVGALNKDSEYNNGVSKYEVQIFKNDGSIFDDSDITKLSNIDGITSIRSNCYNSTSCYYEIGDDYFYAYPRSAKDFCGTIIEGRLPIKSDEIVLNLPSLKSVVKQVKVGSKIVVELSYEKSVEFIICGYTIDEDSCYFYEDFFVENYIPALLTEYCKKNYVLCLTKNANPQKVMNQVLDLGYNCTYQYGTGENFSIYNIISFAISLAVIGVGYLVVLITQGSVRTVGKQKKKDYNIMRTVGMSNSFIKSVYYVEMGFSALFAWIGSLILCIIISMVYSFAITPSAKYGFKLILANAGTITWVIILALFVTLFVAESCAFRFNKKFFKYTVKNSLSMEEEL